MGWIWYMRQSQAVFANFVCKFGEKNLLDLAQEVVLPAFSDDAMIRRRRGQSFHFQDVELLNLGGQTDSDAEPVVAGRFVNDTTLRRVQYRDVDGNLVQDEQKLQSSPSAVFVLLLNDHRLIYWAETPAAPSLQSFASTAERFITEKYWKYIDALYQRALADRKAAQAAGERLEKGSRVTKKALVERFGPPTLRITPITDAAGLRANIARYSILQRVDVVVQRRNEEIDANKFMNGVADYNELLQGQQTRVITTDSGGLNKEHAADALEEIGKRGNQDIKLKGIDEQGNQLTVTEEDFSVKAMVAHLPGSIVDKARGLYGKLRELVAGQALTRPRVGAQTRAKALAAVRPTR